MTMESIKMWCFLLRLNCVNVNCYVSIVKTLPKRPTQKPLPLEPCPSCGAKDQWRSACSHRSTVCSCCKCMRHLARVC